MKASTIVRWMLITQVVSLQWQTPFSWYKSDDQPIDPPSVHYSSLSEAELPINLQQYMQDIVIRVNYGDDEELYKYLLTNEDFKIWGKSRSHQQIDVQVTKTNVAKLEQLFPVNYEIIIADLPQAIFESYPDNFHQELHAEASTSANKYKITDKIINSTKLDVFSELFFKDYRPLETINAWLSILEQTFPDLVTIETIGETYEHRPYKVVHVSARDDGDNGDHGDKRTIVITGGVHAREWISVSTVCYQLYSVLQYYTSNPDLQEILKKLDFLFIPVLNPDGYEYSWNVDRLWRKNRQETIIPRCFGIDIDHSYDFHWTKSSDWPCGEEYSGEVPFEAIESRIWNEYLNKTNNNHEIYGYIDLHSYSQEILFPFAFSCNQNPRDEENLLELAYGISKSIRLQGGKSYSVLPACQDKDADLLPDLGSGTALDFMYHHKAYWAYQLKLRDSGSHGFLLPAKYIEPVGDEIFAGIQYFCSFILDDN